MKKIFLSIIFGIFLLFPYMKIDASKATCTYKYPTTGSIVVTYEYGKKLDIKAVGSSGKVDNNKKLSSSSLKNEDFVDSNGNIFCPKILIDNTPVSKGKYNFFLSISSDGTNGDLEVIKQDNKEKSEEGPLSNNHLCYYNEGTNNEYTLSYLDGEIITSLNGYSIKNYTIEVRNCNDENLFKDKSCPEVYDIIAGKSKKVTVDCKNPIFKEEDPITESDSVENVDTGEKEEITEETGNNKNITYTCKIIGPSTIKYVKIAVNLIKIIIPVLVVAFGMIDFLKVVVSGEEKSLKSAWNSFIKRVIFGVAFMLIPSLLNFILGLFGFADSCIAVILK